MGPLCVSVTVPASDDEDLNEQRGAVDSITPPSFTASEGNERKKVGDGHPSCGGGKSVVDEVKVLVTQSCPTLCDPWTVAYQAPPSMGFSRQECWGGLPFPSPGDLPDPVIEPGSPALEADALTSELPGNYSVFRSQ